MLDLAFFWISANKFSILFGDFLCRNEPNGGSSNDCTVSGKLNDINSSKKINLGAVMHIESDEDIAGPETPGTQRLVPRMKRIQEEIPKFGDKFGSSLADSSKRLKVLEEPTVFDKSHGEASDMASKFEWLDPSRIRDANRRRPGDPLYDKTSLYIPPDALRKMSASQRQYWDVKCQYMDVVIFFKVVS